MASRPTEPTLVPPPARLAGAVAPPLRVLLNRVEAGRRSPDGPPPEEARRALRKLESGSLLFTPEELRRSREAIDAYRRRRGVLPAEERTLRGIADRIGRALAGGRTVSPG